MTGNRCATRENSRSRHAVGIDMLADRCAKMGVDRLVEAAGPLRQRNSWTAKPKEPAAVRQHTHARRQSAPSHTVGAP